MDPELVEEGRGRVQPVRRVVVSPDHHHLERGVAAPRLREKAVVLRLRPRRGIRRVEDVAGHQERVHPLLPDGLEQPAQEGLVFEIPWYVVERMSQVPIRSVKQPHPSPLRSGEDHSRWV